MTKKTLTFFAPWMLMAFSCAAAVTAKSTEAEVRDAAGLFSADAVKQAGETIRNIRKEFRKDVLVETLAGVPEGMSEDYTRDRENFFATLVNQRAKAAQVDGIYVLVMKEPPPHRYRIQVGVGQATRQRAFPSADRDALVRVFQGSFRKDNYDEGLLTGVTFVERTLQKNLRAGAVGRSSSTRAPSSSPFGSWLVIGLFAVGGLMVLSFLLRLFRGGTRSGGLAGAGGLGGAGVGGGGFFSSLLGGIGGAIAGSWLYNQFLGGNAHDSDYSSSSLEDPPRSDIGGDYSSSGGDVDSGGGGDFDGGGGDFGGGGDA